MLFTVGKQNSDRRNSFPLDDHLRVCTHVEEQPPDVKGGASVRAIWKAFVSKGIFSL